MEERKDQIMEKVEEVVQKSEFVRKHQGYFCCTCHLITMILAILYVVGFIACIVIYIMAAQQMAQIMAEPPDNQEDSREQVIEWMDGKSTDYNLAGTLSFALKGIGNVLNENAVDLIDQVNTTVVGLQQSLGVSHFLRPGNFKAPFIYFRNNFLRIVERTGAQYKRYFH